MWQQRQWRRRAGGWRKHRQQRQQQQQQQPRRFIDSEIDSLTDANNCSSNKYLLPAVSFISIRIRIGISSSSSSSSSGTGIPRCLLFFFEVFKTLCASNRSQIFFDHFIYPFSLNHMTFFLKNFSILYLISVLLLLLSFLFF